MRELKQKQDLIDQLNTEKERDAKEIEHLKLELLCYKSNGGSKNTQLEPILKKYSNEKKQLQEQNRKLRLQLKQQQSGVAGDGLLDEYEFRKMLKEYSELDNYRENGMRSEEERLIEQVKFFKKVADQSVRQLMMAEDLLNEEKQELKEEIAKKEARLSERESEFKELSENIEQKYPGVLEYLQDKRLNHESTELASRDQKEQAIFNEQLQTLRKEEDDVFFKEFSDKDYLTPNKKTGSKGSLQETQEAPLSNLQNLFSSLTSSLVKPQSYKKALSNEKLEQESKQILSQPEEQGWGEDNIELNLPEKHAMTERLVIEDGWTSEDTDSRRVQETAPIELDLDEEWL